MPRTGSGDGGPRAGRPGRWTDGRSQPTGRRGLRITVPSIQAQCPPTREHPNQPPVQGRSCMSPAQPSEHLSGGAGGLPGLSGEPGGRHQQRRVGAGPGEAIPSLPPRESLRKTQCFSLMKCPLRTMSCRFSAPSRPTLCVWCGHQRRLGPRHHDATHWPAWSPCSPQDAQLLREMPGEHKRGSGGQPPKRPGLGEPHCPEGPTAPLPADARAQRPLSGGAHPSPHPADPHLVIPSLM